MSNCAAVCLLLVMVGSACTPERDAATWSGSVDTLRNGGIRVTNPSEGIWDSGSIWAIVEDLRIGSQGEEGPQAFGDIRGFDVDEGGRILVLDAQASMVRIFDANGLFVRSVGGPGDGPGEFRQPAGIAVIPGGSFWVAEPFVGRYTLFDSAGTVRSVARSGALMNWNLAFPWHGGADGEGRLYDYTSTPTGVALIRFDPSISRAPTDTFAVPMRPMEEWILRDFRGEVRASMEVPFAPGIVRYIDSAGHLWFGDSGAYTIVERELRGDTLRVISRPFSLAAVSDSDAKKAAEPTEGIIRNGGTIDGPPLPEFKPAYRWFLLDDERYLWVNPYESSPDDGQRLDVFNPNGRFLGTVVPGYRIDPSLLPVIRAGSFYAVARDELDVQYVVRGRIAGR